MPEHGYEKLGMVKGVKSKSVQPIGEARVAACPLCGIQLREKALTYRELYCESCEKEFYVSSRAEGVGTDTSGPLRKHD